MTEHAVVIAGGGPTGLMLAGELTLADIDVVIVERRVTQELDGSRAGGLHPRTIEVLDQRGIAERFVSAGRQHPVAGFAYIQLDVSDFPTRHNYVLALWQRDFERILAGWIDELRVPILRGEEVVGLAQDGRGVDVELAGGSSLRADYLVGCDGGRSVIRKSAGIDFPGVDPSTSFVIAEVGMAIAPEIGVRPEGGGIGPVDRHQDGGPYRVVLHELRVAHAREPTLEDLTRVARRHVRDRLWSAQPELDLPFHRHDPASGLVSRRARASRRRRRPRALPARRPRPQRRRAGRREPGLEARPGGEGGLTRRPARHVPRRNDIRSVRGSSTTPWHRSRSRSPTNATGLSTTPW